ncbi:phage tail protein [Candidatus Neomicrothrix sp.]|jgi:phage tail-like protein|uniref:phage tail protein n=1 Tax=Candidatus Neomicrothrix sp. TaxID=2719034 RepID=UPI001B689370|nr:phage tail protein [Candidatus Microthrix sp.]MBK6311946.1 phage tail protein [Candidatus Microthrix sp.]MBP9051019.1 phage tail protein [Ilumatobacteraceae bacterium]HMS49120.1 phage tail protein [Candidatus Microthrix sp.]
MSIKRDDPYGNFNFLVDLGTGDTSTVVAGFQDVTGLGIEVTTAEYRNGNEPVNHVRKVNGMYKIGDVTLKRGLIGVLDLYQWIDETRRGMKSAMRSVTIHLRDEVGENDVMVWKLTRARPTKYTSPPMNAKGGTDVAIEELVLTYEDLALE